ncbi:MAG TPA: polysaccharide deacetylase family protein [Aquihabitans sp.]|jgi:peptidoglycan/xylan/chitin deacetylase (PgdA/CDA1 family)|nr:polysaccharide deacetylase family protein [Aquihabitans sp.]
MSSSLRAGAARGLRLSSQALDRLRPPPPGTVVLLYHRVGGRTRVPVDIPSGAFADQIAAVAGQAVTLDRALAEGDREPSGGGNRVVVTFDDGTADVVDVALPILVEHGVTALLYLATRFVEEGVDFPDDGRPASWAALADGLSTGHLEIGSHTHGHALLDRIPPASIAPELDRSIGLIQDRLGVDPVHFAYPKALLGSPAAQAAVRARFRSAAVAGTRPNPYGRLDPWRLARSPIQDRDAGDGFARKVAGGLRLEDDVRRAVNRYRYRAATT